MGKVRTKTIKRASRLIVERYYPKLTRDYYTNKRILLDIGTIPSRRLRNKITGYTTHLIKRIALGPVRGISLRLQEEEREKRMDYVPEVSIVDQTATSGIVVDEETWKMVEGLPCSRPSTVQRAAGERGGQH
eukprot:CAMPEP_0201483638 /NCGR_PEP_ID=MMETSP0151_2-20130828/7835_1 /ASSEMBLY_ACC=CAM_ASM_000257 /TAXON_ID=200890 /ORGANISM="Paramoeba atlantica, Strain 621/1 / CCAP 1560/9" /LENGTH=131 /DNA_ID=CAMNT_0047866875 /DNA_START=68 /DNA_END=460 /DNA_ORIENTATION=+